MGLLDKTHRRLADIWRCWFTGTARDNLVGCDISSHEYCPCCWVGQQKECAESIDAIDVSHGPRHGAVEDGDQLIENSDGDWN